MELRAFFLGLRQGFYGRASLTSLTAAGLKKLPHHGALPHAQFNVLDYCGGLFSISYLIEPFLYHIFCVCSHLQKRLRRSLDFPPYS